jgi:hypothetical protein
VVVEVGFLLVHQDQVVLVLCKTVPLVLVAVGMLEMEEMVLGLEVEPEEFPSMVSMLGVVEVLDILEVLVVMVPLPRPVLTVYSEVVVVGVVEVLLEEMVVMDIFCFRLYPSKPSLRSSEWTRQRHRIAWTVP